MTKRRRCQILLDFDMYDRLKSDAIKRGMSVSALIRERLSGAVRSAQGPVGLSTSPLPDLRATLAPSSADADEIPATASKRITIFDFD
jgi:hypothetical protein